MLATITSKGQVTIPAAIRERFGLKQGDRVDFVVEGDEVRMRRVKTLRDFRGALRKDPKASFEEERAAAKQALARRVLEGME